MNRFHRHVAAAIVTLLACSGATAQSDAAHARLKIGDSFLYRQDVKQPGKDMLSYFPQFKAILRGPDNQIVIGATEGRPQRTVPQPVYQVVFHVPQESCLIDVVGGMVLKTGESCRSPLAVDEMWSSEPRLGWTTTCRVVATAEETDVQVESILLRESTVITDQRGRSEDN